MLCRNSAELSAVSPKILISDSASLSPQESWTIIKCIHLTSILALNPSYLSIFIWAQPARFDIGISLSQKPGNKHVGCGLSKSRQNLIFQFILQLLFGRHCFSPVSWQSYSWIGPVDAHEKPIPQRTKRATTISRPPLESSRRGEFNSAGIIFVKVILTFFKITFQIMSEQK